MSTCGLGQATMTSPHFSDDWRPWAAERLSELTTGIAFSTRLPLPRAAPISGAALRAGGVGAAGRRLHRRHHRRGGLRAGVPAGTAGMVGRRACRRRDLGGDRLPARGRPRRYRRRLRRRQDPRAETRHHARQPHRHVWRLRAGAVDPAAGERAGEPRRSGTGGGGLDRGALRRARRHAGGDVLCGAGAQRWTVCRRRPAAGERAPPSPPRWDLSRWSPRSASRTRSRR